MPTHKTLLAGLSQFSPEDRQSKTFWSYLYAQDRHLSQSLLSAHWKSTFLGNTTKKTRKAGSYHKPYLLQHWETTDFWQDRIKGEHTSTCLPMIIPRGVPAVARKCFERMPLQGHGIRSTERIGMDDETFRFFSVVRHSGRRRHG